MTINFNDIINYGNAKFKVVKIATSNDIETINNKINSIDKNRKNSTVYSINDIAFSPSLPSYLVLLCSEGGTTAATEPDFSEAEENETVTDGTVVWTYKNILSDNGGGGVPLAAIIPWVDDVNTVPAGFLLCDGSAVSRTAYPDLFGAIGMKYGAGDGSTTFNVPDLTDAAILNGSYDKTTFTTAGSATFTAPKDGYYKITVKGAGGGGGGSYGSGSSYSYSGGGGGEGGMTFALEHLSTGDTVSVVVGAGGAGGAGNANGSDGGDTTATVNLNTYTAGGGKGGFRFSGTTGESGGGGGTGTIAGAAGGVPHIYQGNSSAGESGGGAGGGAGIVNVAGKNGTKGGGGSGGGGTYTSSAKGGGNGGDGYVWIEYIGTASQYLIKYTSTVVDSEVSAATSASEAKAAAQAAESYAGSAGIPVGTLFPYAADTQTPPTGFLFCNGQAVSRTMYADLFSVLSTTWGAGDGSTTFNLPRSEDLVLQGAGATNPVGTYKSAGLPNIEGSLHSSSSLWIVNMPPAGSTESGALSVTRGSVKDFSGTSSTVNWPTDLNFDASQANAIYGASDTVQPPAACVKFIIKAYDGVTPTSAGIDLSQYASDLSNKADRSLSNLDGNGEQKLTDTMESVVYEDGFAIIYLNGGSESIPANIVINSRYVEANPFPGYLVGCCAEVQVNDEWGNPGWCSYSTNAQAVGVVANQLDDNSIVVQTGAANQYLVFPSENAGNPFGLTTAITGPLPCRVKVWKVGKVANNA